MKLMHVVGARPNFMKVAPVIMALHHHREVEQYLVHTGQHYDALMSDIFFSQLGIPRPDINLEVGSGSHAWQTAQVMIQLEKIVQQEKPDMVLVFGDVNSTVAAALVCAKLLIPVAHIEAGLRSFDRTMPEEINRLITDQIADVLFTPSADADKNLLREGITLNKIFCVGNVMIDTLVRLLPEANKSAIIDSLGLAGKRYVAVTLHRPSNVDNHQMLLEIIASLDAISNTLPVIFPIHPRTLKMLNLHNFKAKSPHLRFLEPLSYLDFLSLQEGAVVVVTDSGGIQEETTYLGIPCITLRENTERPITVELGTNVLIGQDFQRLPIEIDAILHGHWKVGHIPPLWDGHAAERIANILLNK